MKSPLPSPPTPRELDLLQVLWPISPATVQQVHQLMSKERPDLSHGAILRLMQIMHTKDLLVRDETHRFHLYSPAQAQEIVQTSLMRQLIQSAFSGSASAMLMTLVRSGTSEQEREEIQRLVREHAN
ncbi:BlaI/MecI/CopY family transcriptional regulator [Duganella sp. FT50W]|uniref:BlaI/MecI/CopY family transcriptional regulator n=1 Tax=Duganella lactea TaxID=2692173 RepID=A0A6L8MS74_9BURK|nr:BlaI/MecI/CopY family transcriptional regulator [Duganella lactea]MYM84888.1 BlaI/MecI/CopY family transcriptional regulator [Duganella lactea]